MDAVNYLSSSNTSEPGDVRALSDGAGGMKVSLNTSVTQGAVKDGGPGWTSVWGIAGQAWDVPDQSTVTSPITDLPTSGQKLVITDVIISVDTAMKATLAEETTGTKLVALYMAANSSVQYTPRSKNKLATANKRLTLRTSVSGNVAATASYYSEA